MIQAKQLKIGIDCRMIEWGGVGTYTKGLINGLRQSSTNHKFILIFSQDSIAFNYSGIDNFQIIETPYPVFSFRHLQNFTRLLNSLNLDVFHSPHFVYPWLYNGKGVATIHDLIPLKYPKTLSFKNKLIFKLATRLTLKNVSKVISVSDQTKKDILNLFKINKSKIAIIHEAVDESFRTQPKEKIVAIKKKYGIQKKYILYVGAYKPHKNIEGLVKAFGMQDNNLKNQYDLILVGKRDFRYLEVDRLINRKNLHNIIQIDKVADKDLASLYSGSSLFVFPSFYEGFGLPPLEAMACGVPVIASNISSLPEILGQNALFIDPYNINELAGAIRFLLSDKDLKNNLKEKGLNHIKIFSWQKMAEETLAIYESLADSS